MTDRNTVRKEITVNASREHAFTVFTQSFDKWWPRTHHIGKAELKKAVLEPKLGGRWYERGTDDTECDWGTVIAWEPPARFVVTWKLTAEYHYDPNFETEVEVTFEALGANKTHVVLQHKHLDRYGDKIDQIRKSVGNEQGGWGGIMRLYAAIAEGNDAAFKKELDRIAEQIGS